MIWGVVDLFSNFCQISGMNRIDDGHTLSLLACAFTRATGRNFQIEGEIEDAEGGTADLMGLLGLGQYIII